MYNADLAQMKAAYPDDKNIQSLEEMALRDDIIDFEIEMVIDVDAFQGSDLTADPNATNSYYMVNDGAESIFVGSAVPGSKQIGVDENGNTTMHGHHPSWSDESAFPKQSSQPSSDSETKNTSQ
jgi:hypothetical protein